MCLLCASIATNGYAEDIDAVFDHTIPTPNNLAQLKQKLEKDPYNLDNWFDYARMAKALNEYDKAVIAYQTMLKLMPDLHRIKLELAVLYVRSGNYDEAAQLLNEVEATNPPDTVQNNIELVQGWIDKQTKEHIFSGSVGMGVNYDSNANSAPSTGRVTILDTDVVLGDESRHKPDHHSYVTATLNHTYRPLVIQPYMPLRWNSSFSVYLTEQNTRDELNLRVFSLRTGPEMVFESGVRAGLSATYAHIDLDEQTYLKNPKGEAYTEVPISRDLLFAYAFAYEYLGFVNSDTVSTYTDRKGNAYQHSITLRHIFSDTVSLDGSFVARREQASREYHANRQRNYSLGYTQLFEGDYFGSARAGFEETDYDEADLLISSRVRTNDEWYGSMTLGKRFEEAIVGSVIWTLGYQYRNIQSNIQNYEYKNHRVSTGLSWGF